MPYIDPEIARRRIEQAVADALAEQPKPDFWDRHPALLLLLFFAGAILFTIVTQPILGGFWGWQTGKP